MMPISGAITQAALRTFGVVDQLYWRAHIEGAYAAFDPTSLHDVLFIPLHAQLQQQVIILQSDLFVPHAVIYEAGAHVGTRVDLNNCLLTHMSDSSVVLKRFHDAHIRFKRGSDGTTCTLAGHISRYTEDVWVHLQHPGAVEQFHAAIACLH